MRQLDHPLLVCVVGVIAFVAVVVGAWLEFHTLSPDRLPPWWVPVLGGLLFVIGFMVLVTCLTLLTGNP